MSGSKQSASAIVVKNIPRGVSEEVLNQYFFSRGGEIKQFTLCEEKKEATIEFEDSAAVSKLLACEHRIGRHVITISAVSEHTTLTEDGVKKTERVLLKGISSASARDLQLHLSRLVAGVQCTGVTVHGKQAVAVFDKAVDIQALHRGSENCPFHSEHELSISPLDLPTHILISGLPPGTPEFALSLYLEKLGAEAEHVELLTSNQAIVKFTTCDGCKVVLQTPTHVLGGIPVSVAEYYPGINSSDECDFSPKQMPTEGSLQKYVKYEPSLWRALSLFPQKLHEIERKASSHGVKLELPSVKSPESTAKVVGEGSAVALVVKELEELKQQIHMSSKKFPYTPGLWAVLCSMEDKIRLLEQDCKVAVTISADRASITKADIPNQVAFTVSITEKCLIEVCIGDYTKHVSADTIISILVRDVDQQYLKPLVSSGGRIVYEGIQSRMKELSAYELPQVFETKPHELQTKKLLHCLVPKWSGKESSALETALSHALASSIASRVVIAPATMYPINYPPEVVAEAVMKALQIKRKIQFAEMHVAVYTIDMDEAQKVGNYFQQHNLKINFIHLKSQIQQSSATRRSGNTAISVREIESTLPSLVSVIKGDMLQQKVDAYVNSTNPDLDLSRGYLSKQLLEKAGQELQTECSKYAPLPAGQVAVTSARNLHCKVLLHVALPNYHSTGSERVLRETIKKLLQVAMDSGVSSIAVPSLGAGKLGYPPQMVAVTLFSEVLLFNQKNPSSNKKFVFVLAENSVYESFIKVYTQQLCEVGTHAAEAPLVKSAQDEVDQRTLTTRLYIKQGNIEEEDVDVIVNPTTHDVSFSSNPVSQAIGKMAGPSLRTILADNHLTVSENKSILTKASGQLHSKKLLHVYTPMKHELHETQIDIESVIFSVVLEALRALEDNGFQTISVPLLGFGYPVEERITAMLKAVLKFGQNSPHCVQEIRFVVRDQLQFKQAFGCYSKLKAEHCGFTQEAENEFLEIQPRSRMMFSRKSHLFQPWHVTDLKSLDGCSATISTYSTTLEPCNWIIQEIEGILKGKLITEIIQEEHIGQLIHSDCTYIMSKVRELGVTIDVDTKCKQITLSGEESTVRQAQAEVTKMLSTFQHANTSHEWRRLNEATILKYPKEVSVRLEIAHSKGHKLLEVCTEDINAVIDLSNMQEMCKVSGKTMSIQRVEKHTRVDYPAMWEPQPVEHGQEMPCHMFQVMTHSKEYQMAVKEFDATMHGMQYNIIRVQRIQNPNEYAKHCAFLEVLRRKYGGKVLEKRLFHGTSFQSVPAIAHQGFNRIFAADANAAVFGKGVYFAARANYSAQEKYAAPDEYGNQHMFICNVIVGKYTKGEKTMKVAPPLDRNKNEHMLFDTLVDNTANPVIYVTMSDSQAYPEYLITFRSRRK